MPNIPIEVFDINFGRIPAGPASQSRNEKDNPHKRPAPGVVARKRVRSAKHPPKIPPKTTAIPGTRPRKKSAAALFFLGLVPGIAVVFGGIFGGCFALLTRFRATTPGAGLLWGLSFSFLLWLAGPAGILPKFMSNTSMGMLGMARAHFAELVGYLLVFGAPLGLLLGAFSAKKAAAYSNARSFSLSRALVAGGLAGIVGGW